MTIEVGESVADHQPKYVVLSAGPGGGYRSPIDMQEQKALLLHEACEKARYLARGYPRSTFVVCQLAYEVSSPPTPEPIVKELP